MQHASKLRAPEILKIVDIEWLNLRKCGLFNNSGSIDVNNVKCDWCIWRQKTEIDINRMLKKGIFSKEHPEH